MAQLVWQLNYLNQIEVSVDGNSLLNTATDCLRFVTEFFEVISQSAPHIYHSALQLVPRSSTIWERYSQQIGSPMARVITGIPTSWDSCIASAGVKAEDNQAVWSPCGKSIAVGSVGGIEIRDSNTLERLSALRLRDTGAIVRSLAFSPNGCLLACIYGGSLR